MRDIAPLRDYLSPKDPKTSPLLYSTKEHYFTRLLVNIDPNKPNFVETWCITSEDVNVEHLLYVFTTIDANSDGVWGACANFIVHLYWHKSRVTILKPRIEGLPDDHHSKPGCLYQLARLFGSVGDRVEERRLLIHTLKLWREWGCDTWVASTLVQLSDVSRQMGLHKEGIPQAKEALEIRARLGDKRRQAECLAMLSLLLNEDKQLDAAEEAASRAIDLPEKGEEFRVCESHRILGRIYQSKGQIEKAIHHFKVAIGIASHFNWHESLFWAHYNLAGLSRIEDRFDDARAHIEHAKSYTVHSAYLLGHATEEQARVWYDQDRLEEARTEALRAVDVYEKLGAAEGVERCRALLQAIENRN